ncbi:SDR family oxidoreductase [Candidatus Neomarinimicrobiota bacterium]
MDLKLKDKSVVVLASGSGIGKGVALEFARENAKVMMVGRTEDKLQNAQNDIFKKTGNKPDYFVADITDGDQIQAAIEKARELNGPIYALFNNTGGPTPGNFENFNDDDWYNAFNLTLLSYIRTIRCVLPDMKKNGGRIVNNTSSSIKRAIDNLLFSNVFRTGIVGLTKSLAKEFGKYNILVNVVGAGKISTERVDQIDSIKAAKANIPLNEYQDANANSIPLRRYGNPEELGKLVTFLSSDANTYITGQNILVEGGLISAY